MKRTLLVYSKSLTTKNMDGWPAEYIGFRVVKYHPRFGNFSQYGLSWIVNLLWFLFSWGNFSVLVLLDDKLVVHYSYITPKVFRFPFMKKGDMQVGPCVTHESYRGRGIFSSVLELVPRLYPQSKTIWTYTTEDDIAAQKAFKNAGYSFITFAEMSLRTKIVRFIK